MIELSTSTLLMFFTALAIVLAGWSLWQSYQRAGGHLTLPMLIKAVASLQSTAKQLYDDALIAVQYVEQISKPEAPGADAKLTNEQKKAEAMRVLKRRWPNANLDEIDQAIEAAVFAVKALGLKVPEVKIVNDTPTVPAEIPPLEL